MKRNEVVQALLLSFILLTPHALLAAEWTPPPFSAKVRVFVSGSENIIGQAESYIKRELRSLKDVDLVDEGSEWDLNIIVAEVKNRGKNIIGIVLSAVISSKPGETGLSMFNLNESWVATLKDLLYYLPDHRLLWGDADSLRSLCSDFVTGFDSQILEERRRSWRKITQDYEKKKSF